MSPLRAFFFFALLSAAFPAGAQGNKVKLLCNWTDTNEVPLNSSQYRYNEVWGFTANGREYGVIGSSVGAHIIDVSTCKEVVFAPGRAGNAGHRDYKTFKNFLYASSEEGMSTLQIFDTHYLPDSLHLVYESDPQYFSRTHKLFIDTNTAKLYCPTFTNLTTGRDFMRVYSLQKPDSPALLSIYNDNGEVHDVYVRNDTAFCSSSFAGYFVEDFSIPPNHTLIGQLVTYPFKGFSHSSWIGSDGIGVMADETFGLPLKVIDTRDMSRLKVLSTFSPRGTDNTSVPHNPYIIGHFAYISYYMDGFQLYDLSDPVNPKQAGWYHTYEGSDIQGYQGAWGCYPFLPSRKVLISDMQRGLFVLDADEATGTSKETTLAIFPNPTTDQLYLRLPYTMGGLMSCTIVDVVGRQIAAYTFRLNDLANPPVTLPLPSRLPGGMYVLRAAVGGQLFTAKFIKL